MFAKEIKYTDYNGVERNEKFYFNLSKTEIAELEIGEEFSTKLKTIVETENKPEMLKMMKFLVLASYGVKSEDGKRFIKNEQLKEEFSQTEAFNVFYLELLTNEVLMQQFIKGVIPALSEAQSQELQAHLAAVDK